MCNPKKQKRLSAHALSPTSNTAHRSLLERVEPMAILAILVLAAALRFYNLDGSSLWSDEGNTWALMSRSFEQIARDSAADIHPPGYYWLLKIWTEIFGRSAAGMRSFSALAGVLLVLLIYRIAKRTVNVAVSEQIRAKGHIIFPLLAALIATLNPFQIYYSQEARMYMLLALAGAGFIWALLGLICRPMRPYRPDVERTVHLRKVSEPPLKLAEQPRSRRERLVPEQGWPVYNALYALAYLLFGLLGLWTHYSFPIVLAAATGAYLLTLRKLRNSPTLPTSRTPPTLASRLSPQQQAERPVRRFRPPPRLLTFVMLNGLLLLGYLPWLPTAIQRLMAWPRADVVISPAAGLAITVRTLTFGPIRNVADVDGVQTLTLLAVVLLPLLGLWVLRHNRAMPVLGLWFVLPVGLMFSLNLFTDAFLKFLLTASPAWTLLVAASVLILPRVLTAISSGMLATGAIALAMITLPVYYSDHEARDNYAGVARYVSVLGDPQTDIVLLNASGQQEVWDYYHDAYDINLPVLALPKQRPIDVAQTTEMLSQTVAERSTIYALFWATNESDPGGAIEGWLDQHAFKGLNTWQGNVRFVTYSQPNNLNCTMLDNVRFGEQIVLLEECQPQLPQRVTAGEIALVSLRWQADAAPMGDYAATLQLLDARNQVVAQRDSKPSGGARPTSTWQAGETVVDNHGVVVPPGTPPGVYRLIVALYEPTTGERLPTREGDFVSLGTVHVERPVLGIPPEVIEMQHRFNARLNQGWLDVVRLAGYDMHRKGADHAPQTPLAAGDLLHFNFYWQAPDPLPNGWDVDWPGDIEFTLRLGEQTLTAPLAGGGYPTVEWHPGEIVRGEFDILFDGTSRQPVIEIFGDQLRLDSVPTQ